MNKISLLISVLFIGCISIVEAQVQPGIKLGVNNSNLSNTTLETKSDYYLGALINIPITEYYTLQPEILYSRIGLDLNLGSDLNLLSNSYDDEFEISPVDLTFTGGIGYDFGFGLVLEARYKQGTISTDFFGSRDLFEEDGRLYTVQNIEQNEQEVNATVKLHAEHDVFKGHFPGNPIMPGVSPLLKLLNNMRLLTILFLFVSTLGISQELKELRVDYPKANLDKEITNTLYETLSSITKEDNKTIVAYKGSIATLKARFAKGIRDKKRFFKEGAELLEFAITSEPKNLRFDVCD
ncbi:hypothetical protein GQR58_030719 [Nymphon striatum]|nr:hypothetical protein GQR58_030719 [Nymphon striatum]